MTLPRVPYYQPPSALVHAWSEAEGNIRLREVRPLMCACERALAQLTDALNRDGKPIRQTYSAQCAARILRKVLEEVGR